MGDEPVVSGGVTVTFIVVAVTSVRVKSTSGGGPFVQVEHLDFDGYRRVHRGVGVPVVVLAVAYPHLDLVSSLASWSSTVPAPTEIWPLERLMVKEPASVPVRL